MNNEYRSNFKQILDITNLGSSLKGNYLLFQLKGGHSFKLFGNTPVKILNELGEVDDVLAYQLRRGQLLHYKSLI
jgi:hypothetical protein